MRQLALKMLTGLVALIPASYAPRQVGVLALSLQLQGAAVAVCMVVLSLQVQYLNVRRTGSRLTGSFGDKHDPAVLGYLVLKTLQMADMLGLPPPYVLTRSLSLPLILGVRFLSLADLKVKDR